ncbi:hypothetical protein CU098_011264, partial [Rhizopus stolonifer]
AATNTAAATRFRISLRVGTTLFDSSPVACINIGDCGAPCIGFSTESNPIYSSYNAEKCSDQDEFVSAAVFPKQPTEFLPIPDYLVVAGSSAHVPCAWSGSSPSDSSGYFYCPPLPSTVYGQKKGNGYKEDCCKTEADCKDDCIKGKCNGPSRKTTTVKKTKTTATTTSKSATPTSGACKSGYRGKKKGNGPKNACCSTERDCKEDCVKGKCT